MKRNIRKLLISSTIVVGLLFLTVPQSVSAITVLGKACPFFAGQTFPVPPATTGDSADYHLDQTDPTIMPPHTGVCSGSTVSITAAGIWGHPALSGPDGIGSSDDTHDEYVDLGGISRVIAPLNTLVGVFLTDDPPNPGAMPASLTLGVDDMTTPELQQAFAIGSSLEFITVPAGATRLFFGHNDGFEWINNVGFLDVTVTTIVDIDIKPGSFPNAINKNGKGVIPVAILGSECFDVTQIDLGTLSFEGLEVRLKGNGQPQCSIEDVSGDLTTPEGAPDGYPDLVCQFVDDMSSWPVGDGEATLTGLLLDGTPFEGTDSIKVVK